MEWLFWLSAITLSFLLTAEGRPSFTDGRSRFKKIPYVYDVSEACTNGLTYNGECYFLGGGAVSWPQAVAACEAADAELAVVHKQRVITFINGHLLPKYGLTSAWVGLSDIEGRRNFIWMDGRKLDKTLVKRHWDGGVLSPVAEADCVRTTTDGNFRQELCDVKFNYVCKKYIDRDANAVHQINALLEKEKNKRDAEREGSFYQVDNINSRLGIEREFHQADIKLTDRQRLVVVEGANPESVQETKEERDRIKQLLASQETAEEGLTLLEKVRHRAKRNAISESLWGQWLWQDGRIYYEFDTSMPAEGRMVVRAAMDLFESKSCVRFIPRTTEPDYLSITSIETQGCWSWVGRVEGAQEMSLSSSCRISNGTMQHEMMHALGFWHEHSRPDRNDYVTVNFENIKEGYQNNFDILGETLLTTMGIAYDYESIMHYGRSFFAVDTELDTLTPLSPPDASIGVRNEASDIDYLEINRLYGCPNPVDGGWDNWSAWTACSVSCDSGTRTRSRTCTLPEPENSGAPCTGSSEENNVCGVTACPATSITWLGCWRDDDLPESFPTLEGTTDTLQGDYQLRENPIQACADAAAAVGVAVFALRFDGKCLYQPADENSLLYRVEGPSGDCTNSTGSVNSMDVYQVTQDPVAGGWSLYSTYTKCSVPCGGGTRTHTRTCTNPAPALGGSACEGAAAEEVACNTQHCPVDGGWGLWMDWTSCSTPCGGGTTFRSRECDSPVPEYGGKDCSGSTGASIETADCNIEQCVVPVDGGWTDWGGWTACSLPCGSGTRSQIRMCTAPAPADGGLECVGTSVNIEACNAQPCPVDGSWSDWTTVMMCSVTCGLGVRTDERTCMEPLYGGVICEGPSTRQEACDAGPCPVDGDWAPWAPEGGCSEPCGPGTVTYTRTCTAPAPQYGGFACTGADTKQETCQMAPCPIDGAWSGWTVQDACNAPCGGGVQLLRRMCSEPAPQFGGALCEGESEKTEVCNLHACDDVTAVPSAPTYESVPSPDWYNSMDAPHLSGSPSFSGTGGLTAQVTGRVQQAVTLSAPAWADASPGDVTQTCLNDPDTCESGFTVALWLRQTPSQRATTLSDRPLMIFSSGVEAEEAETPKQGLGVALYFRVDGNLKVLVRTRSAEFTTDLPSALFDNTVVWHAIHFTFSAQSGIFMYYRGQKMNWDIDGRTNLNPVINVYDVVRLGRPVQCFDHFFEGSLDELTVWQRELTPNQIKSHFTSAPAMCQDCDVSAVCQADDTCVCRSTYQGDGYTCTLLPDESVLQVALPKPLLYWPMNEIRNRQVAGSAPLAAQDDAMFVSQGVRDSGAIMFNGRRDWLDAGEFSGQCVSYPDACADGVSVGVWLEYYGRGDRPNYIMSSGGHPLGELQTGLSMWVGGGLVHVVIRTSDVTYDVTAPEPEHGDWHHWAMTWSQSSGLTLYTDGQVVGSSLGSQADVVGEGSAVLAIGKPNNMDVFNGRMAIDSIGVWGRRLAHSEVKALVAYGVSGHL